MLLYSKRYCVTRPSCWWYTSAPASTSTSLASAQNLSILDQLPTHNNKKTTSDIREGFKKKNWKKYGLLPTRGGGGVSEGDEKPNCFFEQSIFQRVSRIILGPSKHVLHLVWSVYFISTAVRTALKVARTPQILGERRQL